MNVDLRPIGIDDWPLWRNLRLQALEEAPYAYGSVLADWQGEGDTEIRWKARLTSVPLNIIAETEGTGAGMVSATAPNEHGTVELISMYVAPFARGQGVGDSLVRAVLEWARRKRAARVVLAVREPNDRATVLYLRHGFVDAGVIEAIGSENAVERKMVHQM